MTIAMDILDLIRSRTSIRCFTDRPVDRSTVADLLEAARWAPSASNQQPWHFIAVTGAPLQALCDALRQAREQKKIGYDPSKGNTIPPLFVERTKKLFRDMKPLLRETTGAQRSFIEDGSFRFYGAPVVVFIALHRSLPQIRCLDVGMAAQNFMLAAHDRGLGTCAIALTLLYSDVISKHLCLPDELALVLSIALGYPDTSCGINAFRSSREDMETIVTWRGFASETSERCGG